MIKDLTLPEQPQQRIPGRMIENRWMRDESQRVVAKNYSSNYNTRSRQSRLQLIQLKIIRNCAFLCATSVKDEAIQYARTRRTYTFSFIIHRDTVASTDSDLDAFSRYPTDDSFTALASQPTVFTNYLEKLFLSY